MSLDDLPDLNVSFSREELEDKFGFSGDVEGDYYIEQIKEKASSETKRIRDVLVDKLESAINQLDAGKYKINYIADYIGLTATKTRTVIISDDSSTIERRN